MNSSIEMLQEIQCSLNEFSDSLEDMYYKIRKECMDEVVGSVRRYKTQKNEMLNLYKQLLKSEQRRISWIKSRLPWYITKFNNIRSYEISLRDTSIFIGVSFRKNTKSCCYIELTPKDIGWKDFE